jgi:C4-type Zn-finger protein
MRSRRKMKKCPKCSKEGLRLSIRPYYGTDPFPNAVIKMICPFCGFTTSDLAKYADDGEESKPEQKEELWKQLWRK